MTKSGIKRLLFLLSSLRLFDQKCGISQQKVARNVKCTQPLVNWKLKNKTSIRKINLSSKCEDSQVLQLSKMNISCYKREKKLKYSEEPVEKAKNLCKKFAKLLYRSPCCLFLHNEKYFTYDGSNMQENVN